MRRIGVLVSGILASVALMCVTASGAAAEQRAFFLAGEKSAEAAKQPRFEGELYPTYLYGGVIGITGVHEYGFTGGEIECGVGEFKGKMSSKTNEILLTPLYSAWACTVPFGALSINTNGCVHKMTVLNQGPPYVGEWAMSCPPEESFEFVLNFSGKNCTISIPSQSGFAGVSYANKGEGKKRYVEYTVNVSGIKYTTTTNAPIISPCKEVVGTYENGTFTGGVRVEGSNIQF